VIQSLTPLSIFAQTLALINGAVAIGTISLRVIATRCGRRIIKFDQIDNSISDPATTLDQQRSLLHDNAA
jgi:hypothetical protein